MLPFRKGIVLSAVLLCSGVLSAQQTVAPGTGGYGRYRVSVAVPAAGDGGMVVRQPAAAAQPRPDTTATNSWATGTYDYDGSGNIKTIGTDQFVYDAFGRVTSGMARGEIQQYTYDNFGNLLTITTGQAVNGAMPANATTITLGVNPATNRLTDITKNASGTYDAAGRLKSWTGGASYTYDGLGMIKTSTSGSTGPVDKVYLYTPNDERIATVTLVNNVEASSEWTLRDISGKVLRRLDKYKEDGTWKWRWREDYIYLGSQLLAAEVDTSARTLHFFPDHLGTARLITGNGGAQIARHDYLPFGEEATTASVDTERLKFTGHERDASGLDYMHARYYSSGWGRFLSVDPSSKLRLQQPQSWNRYTYALNNPVKYVDPDGRDTVVFIVSNGSGWDEKGGHAAVWVESGNRSGGVSRGGYDIDRNGWKGFLEHYTGEGREVHAYVLKTTGAQDQAMLNFIDQKGDAAGTDVNKSVQTCGLMQNCSSAVVNVLKVGGVVPATSDPSAARGANSPFVLKNELDHGQLKPQVQQHIDFVPPPPLKKESWWSRVIDGIF